MKYLQKFDNHAQYESADMPMYSVAYDEEHVHFEYPKEAKFYLCEATDDGEQVSMLLARVSEYDNAEFGYGYNVMTIRNNDDELFEFALFTDNKIFTTDTSVTFKTNEQGGNMYILGSDNVWYPIVKPVEPVQIIRNTNKGYMVDDQLYAGVFEDNKLFIQTSGYPYTLVGNPGLGDPLIVQMEDGESDKLGTITKIFN